MIASTQKSRRRPGTPAQRSVELQDVLQSLSIVLDMEPDHIDGAIDLLDEAIHSDHSGPSSKSGSKQRN